MTDKEKPDEAADAAAGGDAEPPKPPPLKPVPKPDETEFREKIDAAQAEQQKLQRQLKSVQQEVNDRRSKTQELQKALSAERKKLDPLRKARNQMRSERKKLYDLKDAANERIQAKKQIAQKMKDALRFTNLDQIDSEIRKLEYQQKTTSFGSLIQEKAHVREIEKLKSQRKSVARYSDATRASKDDEAAVRQLRQQIRDASKKLGDAEKKLDAQSSTQRDLQKQHNAGKDLRPLFKKMNEIRDKVSAKREELNVLHRERRAKMADYNEYIAQVRKRKNEQRQKENADYREEQEKLRKEREEEKAKEKPWMAEIGACDTLINYLNSLLPKDKQWVERRLDDGNAFTKEEFFEFYGGTDEWDNAPPAPRVIKEQRQEELTLADGTVIKPLASKKGNDMIMLGGNRHKRNRNRKKTKKKMVRHTPDTLYTFSLLKISPPKTVTDIEASLEKLQTKRDYYDKLPRAVPKAKKSKKSKAAPKAVAKAAAHNGEATSHSAAAEEKKADAPLVKLLEAGDDYNEYITYDDDFALGGDAPALDGLEACQCGPVPQYDEEKITVVYFWAKFLKWQCYPSLIALHELNKEKEDIQVVAVSVDPTKDAILSHIKKAKKYTAEMGVKAEGWTGGKTDLCLCFDQDNAVKKEFRKLTRMDAFMAPSAYIVQKGKVVWRSSFSAGYPYHTSRFAEQLAAVEAGEPLYKFGPNPKPPEPEEDLEGYEEGEEADDVFAAAAKDGGSDGAW